MPTRPPEPPGPATTPTAAPDDEAAFLASYDGSQYPPVAVTADIVLLTVRAGRLAVLLVQRKGHPYRGQWALPGGFVEPDEELDDAARRELQEETGVRVASATDAAELGHLEQLRTYGTPDRDPRMRVVSVAYVGFTAHSEVVAGSDAADARFWTVDDLAIDGVGSPDGAPLAFDHARVIADGIERARAKLEYTTLATAFLDEPFTLGELRRVYEAVWGETLHEGNFRRKVLSTPGFVEPTGRTAPTDGRPAALYARGKATQLHPPILRP
jgi:8-oxo-dGTP diphosphatase